MNRTEIINRLRAIEPRLTPLGVAGLYLFGSYARDEAGQDSDVDLFVDKAPGRKFGFDEFMAATSCFRRPCRRRTSNMARGTGSRNTFATKWNARRSVSCDGRDEKSARLAFWGQCSP